MPIAFLSALFWFGRRDLDCDVSRASDVTFPPSIPSQIIPERMAAVRASACPGLLRIVQALDGGICRIKLPCGELTAAQAEAIALAASRCANANIEISNSEVANIEIANIEITNRANLQIRGIQTPDADELITALLDAGLGAATPGADDVRNVMVSPSAGIDSAALINTQPLATKILALLQSQTRLHQLSPKFSVSLDGGERLAMLEHPHDFWLSAIPTNTETQITDFVFGLAGCPAHSSAIATVATDQVVALVEAAFHTFLDLATPEQARMRQLLQTISAQEFLRHVQKRLPFALSADTSEWRRQPAQSHAHIGVHTQSEASLCYVGAVPPLGRVHATQLRALAQLATQFGDGTLRLTPWQGVLLPNIENNSTDIVANELQQLGFSTQLNEPLAHLIACTGARGCAKGLADTKADALQLAQLLDKKTMRPVVHFSGCARSCASASTAPFTLLAVATGRYDLFQRDLFQRKESAATFGKLIASDIDISQALKQLEDLTHLETSKFLENKHD
jgi:precorrin-3B synthase